MMLKKEKKTVKTKAGSNQREKRKSSSLQTLMYSSVYSFFRHLARKAQCRGRASGSKGKGERVVLHRNSGYAVESKPSAKGSPAPERWPEDDACCSQRFWHSVVCCWWGTIMSALVFCFGLFFVFFLGGKETTNKQKHQRAPAEWVRASHDGVVRLCSERRFQAYSPAKGRKPLQSLPRSLSSWIFTSSYKLCRYSRRQRPWERTFDKTSNRDVVDLDLSFPLPKKGTESLQFGFCHISPSPGQGESLLCLPGAWVMVLKTGFDRGKIFQPAQLSS